MLDWIADPDPRRGIRFAKGADWEHWPYADLAALTRQVAAGLIAYGVRRGDVVSIVQTAGPRFVATLFGALYAGCAASPAAPPMTFGDRDRYRTHVAGLLRTARPALVVTDADLAATIGEIAAPLGTRVAAAGDVLAAGENAPDAPGAPGDLALLQFTSGSSGRARGVAVPYDALAANVAAIRSWLAMTRDDATATWLPVHHDMGLIGCLITPVVNGGDLWQMPPEEFVRDPARFLRCFGNGGAVLTSMPNFGLAYAARRVRPRALEGLDVSALRAVIVGAERVDERAVARFCAVLEPYGFDPRAVLPAYGLAEATLAVTGLPLATGRTTLSIRPDTVRVGAPVGTTTPDDPAARPVTGCGTPLDGAQVSVTGEDGAELAAGTVGEIVVRGPSVARGYVRAENDTGTPPTSVDAGTLRTGDIGFLHDGQLYVLGRLGDSVKIRGRALFAEDVELALAHVGVPPTRMAALLGYRDGAPTVVVALEDARSEWADAAREPLRRHAEGAAVVLLNVPRGTIARTSSGKPRRRRLWQAYADADLPGNVITTGGTDD